jgi:hypothetical protein
LTHIQVNSSKFKQIQANSSKFKQIQAKEKLHKRNCTSALQINIKQEGKLFAVIYDFIFLYDKFHPFGGGGSRNYKLIKSIKSIKTNSSKMKQI